MRALLAKRMRDDEPHEHAHDEHAPEHQEDDGEALVTVDHLKDFRILVCENQVEDLRREPSRVNAGYCRCFGAFAASVFHVVVKTPSIFLCAQDGVKIPRIVNPIFNEKKNKLC